LKIETVVEDAGVKLLQLAVIKLPSDVKETLQRAYREEESEAGRTQLEAILKNVDLAEKTGTPICQDTGVIIFYIKAGAQAQDLDKIERTALSIGMSLALVPITGLLLNYTPWGIRLTPITISLLTLTFTFATAAIIREHQAQLKQGS